MKFSFEGESGELCPFSEFSGSAPEKGDRTRGFHETKGHIVHEVYFTHRLSS